jgi:NAD(P)H-dependent FMN reductase
MDPTKTVNLLAISGSIRPGSVNTGVLLALARLAPAAVQVRLYDGLGALPHYSPELDGENSPLVVTHYRTLLAGADGVLICTPEYAFGMPGVLKNALDWTVSSGEFYRKPVAAISASPLPSGGEKAHASLLLTLSALDARVGEPAKLTIPSVTKKLTAAGEIIDPSTGKALSRVLQELLLIMEAGRA